MYYLIQYLTMPPQINRILLLFNDGHYGSDWNILYALERGYRRTTLLKGISWIYQFQTGPCGFGGVIYGNRVDGASLRDPGISIVAAVSMEKAGSGLKTEI